MDDDRTEHRPCSATAEDDGVRHYCFADYGHLGTHECSCGRYWLNSWVGIR